MSKDLDGYLTLYGDVIPEAPKGQRSAMYTVRLTQEWWDVAQSLANDPRHPYNGDVGGVFRHGLLMALKYWMGVHKTGVNPTAWLLEVEQDDQAEDAVKKFKSLISKRVKDADRLRGQKGADTLYSLITTASTFPIPHARLSMNEALVKDKRFLAACQEYGSANDALMLWLEAMID